MAEGQLDSGGSSLHLLHIHGIVYMNQSVYDLCCKLRVHEFVCIFRGDTRSFSIAPILDLLSSDLHLYVHSKKLNFWPQYSFTGSEYSSAVSLGPVSYTFPVWWVGSSFHRLPFGRLRNCSKRTLEFLQVCKATTFFT